MLRGLLESQNLAYADPLGVAVCFKGNSSQVDSLRRALEDATGSHIEVRADNCVTSVVGSGYARMEGLRAILRALVSDDKTFYISLGSGEQLTSPYSHFDEGTRTAVIVRGGFRGGFYNATGGCNAPQANWTRGALVAHELPGHGIGMIEEGRRHEGGVPVGVENWYHAARGQQLRCLLDDRSR